MRRAGNYQDALVAPLAGSVDRNIPANTPLRRTLWSLPSRGAWIEINVLASLNLRLIVAPLTGSVDRNAAPPAARLRAAGRSPHGERG